MAARKKIIRPRTAKASDARPKPVTRQTAPPQKKTRRTPARTTAPRKAPALNRERRRLDALEALEDRVVSTIETERLLSSARTGADELKQLLGQHTETSPALTAGDIDANWGDAYAVGDEAPGGDNPTPDQDRVDDIGRALGVNYEDNEELRGSDKIQERDRHRWELDPASSEDWPHSDD